MLAIDSILAPVDFSPHAELAAAHAAELARTHDATLHVLHVLEEPSFPSFYGAGTAMMYDEPPDLEARAREALQEIVDTIDGAALSVKVHVATGEAGPGIVEMADTLGSDVIVIAGLGRTGVERLMLGSVAQKVVARAPCAVFVVKSATSSLVAGWDPVSLDDEDTSD